MGACSVARSGDGYDLHLRLLIDFLASRDVALCEMIVAVDCWLIVPRMCDVPPAVRIAPLWRQSSVRLQYLLPR